MAKKKNFTENKYSWSRIKSLAKAKLTKKVTTSGSLDLDLDFRKKDHKSDYYVVFAFIVIVVFVIIFVNYVNNKEYAPEPVQTIKKSKGIKVSDDMLKSVSAPSEENVSKNSEKGASAPQNINVTENILKLLTAPSQK